MPPKDPWIPEYYGYVNASIRKAEPLRMGHDLDMHPLEIVLHQLLPQVGWMDIMNWNNRAWQKHSRIDITTDYIVGPYIIIFTK